MVFLAITPQGLKASLRAAASSAIPVWCGVDTVSEEGFAALQGTGLTRFNYELGAREPLVLEDALATIDQHHPGDVVWVEAAASAA